MQYAIVGTSRLMATPKARGVCPFCAGEVMAKCGPRKMHHWAHSAKTNCDSWWENETPWHRAWKSEFPKESREVRHTAPDGEAHIADVKTKTGIILEFQHSAMTDAERESRELFYKNLAWIVDGRPFLKQFHIFHPLPDPESQVAQDIVWYPARHSLKGTQRGLFWRRSENPNRKPDDCNLVQMHNLQEIKTEVEAAYRGDHQYDWVRPRAGWLSAKCPVFIDFGEELLVQLRIYNQSGLPSIRYIAKKKLSFDAEHETLASAIGTRFYPTKS